MTFDALVGTRLLPESARPTPEKLPSALEKGKQFQSIDPDASSSKKLDFREALERALGAPALKEADEPFEKTEEATDEDKQTPGKTGSSFGLNELVVALASAAAARFDELSFPVVDGDMSNEPQAEKDSGSRKNLPASPLKIRRESDASQPNAAVTTHEVDEPNRVTSHDMTGVANSEPKDPKTAAFHAVDPAVSPPDKRAAELLAKGVVPTPPPTVEQPKIVPRAAELARPMQNSAAAYAVRESVRLERTDNGGRAELKLDMGDGHKVELRVEVENGVAKVMMTTRSHELHGWMHRSADQLMRALLDAGLQLDGVDVDTSGEGHHQQQRRNPGGSGEFEAESAVETVWLDALPSKIHIVA